MIDFEKLTDEEKAGLKELRKMRAEREAQLKKDREIGLEYKPFGTIMTDEQWLETNRKIKEMGRKYERRAKRVQAVKDFFRPIIFTPLALVADVLSTVAGFAGKVLALGLIGSVYYFYKTFVAIKESVPIGDIEELPRALILLAAPFVAFFVSTGMEKLSDFLNDCSL